jgi:hypothetical protein
MRERFNDLAEQATPYYEAARDTTFRGAKTAYNTAREYPGTIAAIVVGVGIASFLMWAARRAGGWRNLQVEARDYARQGVDYARDGYGRAREVIKDRASRFRSETPEEL